ncbi:hypothetical protein SAMN04487846_2069 [Microbacterium sp. cf046]|uniref:hypothetical protein n=1 Tax=Microbacterium sp. cf046 TaxID=1761803 RepID=UPI0008E76040|nr:hypothetical protein [Microbacterium sp. cf046]SFS06144.1 hypothetical protein SAMN04487846_2069 [Microbacterium sp. cf046]
MTLTLDAPAGAPRLTRRRDLRLVEAGPALWRIVDRSGRAIGHIQVVGHDQGDRYRARRFHAATRAFRDLGEFWSADDAVECVALAR